MLNLAFAERRARRLERRLSLTRHELSIPDLDPAHDGLRIAHLTDIHVGLLTPRSQVLRAVELTHAARPHLTVLTGDFLSYGRAFVNRMGMLLSGLPGEVTCVLGNHDHWTTPEGVTDALVRQGYAVLRNAHRTVLHGGRPLHIVGIDDAITGHHDVARAFAGVPEGGTVLALSHAPSLADAAIARGARLVLAGHTHGGHINIPRITERIARRLGNRYLGGLYHVAPPGAREGLLFVSRGIGSSTVPRANAPAEVALLTLRRAAP
ncbi:MAG: metallophosphoesterase [Myxococcales bacterium]|nr:metallophosphoesterase [Myxococcales bacterium]